MRRLAGMLMVIALLLAGCQLAREESETSADALIGVLITSDDWTGEKLYAEDGRFETGKALMFPTANDVVCLSADECFESRMNVKVADEGTTSEVAATVYINPSVGRRAYRVNPVYQQADGQIYALAGNAWMVDADGEGARYSTKLESTAARVQDGKRIEEHAEVEIAFETRFPAQTVRILEMNADGIAQTHSFAPDELPETFRPAAGTEYLIVESIHSNGGARRTLLEREGESFKIQVSVGEPMLINREVLVNWE